MKMIQLKLNIEMDKMYHPLELSQSTKELLYISLRLSLIKVLKPYYPFPIIIDDAFVHFDKQRKSMMLNYLRELSQEHQVLYLLVQKILRFLREMLILNKKRGRRETMRNVEKLNSGGFGGEFFLIHRATQGVTAQGKDYMTLYLQDKSGDIEAKLWTVTKDDMKNP